MKGNEQFLDQDISPILLTVNPQTGRINSVTEEASQLYGYSVKEMTGMHFTDLFQENDIRFTDLDKIPYGKKFIRRKKTKDGGCFHAYLLATETEKGVSIEIESFQNGDKITPCDLSGLIFNHISKSKLGFIVWNSKLEVIHWSDKIEEISGFEAGETLSHSILDLEFIAPEKRHKFKKKLFRALDNDQDNFKIKITLQTKSGEVRRGRLHFSIDWNEDNNTVGSVMCMVEDITDGYNQRKKIAESEKRYRALFESSSEGVMIYKNGQFFDCNHKAEELFDAKREQILGKSPIDLSPAFQADGRPSQEVALAHINKALKEGKEEFEWRHCTLHGVDFDTEVNLTRLQIGGEEYLQAIIKDITTRKLYEQKLQESEKLFKDLFLKSPIATVMVDAENRVEMINESFSNLFGYSFEELEGKELDPFIVHENDIETAPRMPARNTESSFLTQEVIRYDKEGNPKVMIVSGIPVYVKGEPYKGFGTYVDISDLKEKEQSIQQSLDEKKVLLAEIHHRVKNNLALISGLLQLQAMKIRSPQTREVLYDTESRIRSIASVHELLYQSSDFSRIPSAEYTEGIVEQMNSLFCDEFEITATTNDFMININQAIPLGLLINEMLIQYSNQEFEQCGSIHLNLTQTNNEIEFRVEIKGLKDTQKVEDLDLSSLLIDALVEQLYARVENVNGEDSLIQIKFEASDARGSASAIKGYH